MELPFKNRLEAARQLAERVKHLAGQGPGVVLAIPRGGVPLGAVLARALGWPLELALSKKIGHPGNPEFAIGSVSETSYVLAAGLHLPADYVTGQVAHLQEQLRQRRQQYATGRPAVPLRGRTVLITDDGIATGHTLRATIQLARQQEPARVVVAVPVAPPEVLRALRPLVDEMICLRAPEDFTAVGQFYEDFAQTTDAEVMQALESVAR